MQKVMVLLVGLAGLAAAQSARPPVVFVRGYDFNWALFGFCTPSDPSGTFGTLPAQVQSDGATVYGFDNCAAAGQKNVPIETLGNLFGQFLTTIPGPQVDVVAHSMGGLIVRAYLAGLQATPQVSTPPQNTRIRKIVFIATPHFGAAVANDFGLDLTDAEVTEMEEGSGFLYNLARWNQGTDDLRAIDSLSVVGNSGITGTDDGLVSMNSASLLSFSQPAPRTRVLPYCHTAILASLGFCKGAGIATAPETATIVRSFLAGTNDWSSVGSTIASGTGGLFFTARDHNDVLFHFSSVTYDLAGDTLNPGVFAYYKDLLGPATYGLTAQATNEMVQAGVNVQPGQFVASLAKLPPVISAVVPSAGLSDARVVAPGSLVSFYGAGLATSNAQFTGLPFPTQLGGTTISSGSTALPLLAVSDGQVNAYIPSALTGFLNVTVKNSIGQHTTTLLVAPAAPTLFTLNNSGSGPASALHATSGTVIGATSPATVGEYVSLYATGLGLTTTSGAGLDVAVLLPQVTVGGIAAQVSFAGRAPGFVGLDQINVQIPAGVIGAAIPVVVSSGGRTSNTVTLAIQ
jgi:uncharacterized protein (TIGR03437 family)